MDPIEQLRALLAEFTDYEPGVPKCLTITDHQFLDLEFWGRLIHIIENAEDY
ncbi:hypothetical protein [Leucobacter chromiiresistens]|uniref:Uncharacterized protein n=1 Tax=Leucobacter chromiiresistens TaxID=1079994 RepID=A0A1H0XQ92_9MICO|nr:hypothetical protein [Leucobacter chromiiresistens]SDQ05104.1 hypothetical protein SAMN04488565_0045 [Leucobacter chromiiresistens]